MTDKFWVVEQQIGNDWENVWTEENDGQREPQTFETEEAALKELDDHLKTCAEAVASGNMQEAPERDDFRTREVDEYDVILMREETEDYNEIDKARDLLSALLDDPDQLIGDDAGAVIQRAIDMIE